MARVVVTGGSGFIDGGLTGRLVARGDEVVALARSDEAAAKVARRGATVARGDVLDEDSLADGMARCMLVYHVAGANTHCPADPDMLLRVNVQGAEAAVRAAARAGVQRLVLTSSAASVGEPPGTVGREDTRHRGSYLGERYVLNGATITSLEALEIVSELSGIRDRVHILPPALARAGAVIAEGGSRATRELGLSYMPAPDIFRRTFEWAEAEGLVTRSLPARPAAATRRSRRA